RETPGIRRRDGHQHGDDADPRLGAAGPAGHRLGPHHVGFDDGDRGAGSGWCAAAAGLPRCHRHAGVPDLCRCGAGTGTPPRGRGGLRQPQAPPLSARGGVDRACRCQRPALAAVQFGLRPDRRVVVEVQRGTSSGRGAGARGPVQCCWRDPGPCNAPGYPRLVQPQWTVRNSCVNRASLSDYKFDELPGLKTQAYKSDRLTTEIVHLVLGPDHFAEQGQEPSELRFTPGPDKSLTYTVDTLADGFISAGTLLLVLHCCQENLRTASASVLERTRQFAEEITRRKGLAVLVASGSDGDLRIFFRSFYKELANNSGLAIAASVPAEREPRLNVTLFLGTNGDGLLRFDHLMEALDQRLDWMQAFVETLATPKINDFELRLLHETQREKVRGKLQQQIALLTSPIRDYRNRLSALRGSRWQSGDFAERLVELRRSIDYLDSLIEDVKDPFRQQQQQQQQQQQ